LSLLEELKRRNVLRVAAAYAVVAWLLIEVADTIFPRLGLPDWTGDVRHCRGELRDDPPGGGECAKHGIMLRT
jgi:hypothetical protein